MKIKTIPVVMIPLIISTVFLSACSEDVDSEDIRTSGIYAGMDVTASADEVVQIAVFLKAGGSDSNTYINLTSADNLTAVLNNNETITLSKIEKSRKEYYYTGTFSSDVAGAENSVIKILFERSNADVSALDSVVTLPAAPSGLASDKNLFQRSNENISLSWNSSNTAGKLRLTYSGSCIRDGSFDVVDNGSYTFNADALKSGTSTLNSCPVNFSLSRTVSGSLDTDFGEGGYLKATQIRTISVNSTP